ncbi:DUF7344 domain-containing protein [Halosimplex halophilum]|uniref:DUF7344 domain-containing protein n=1 Tax=Halosimplex halophilum TaxID=2559572 RepID=UPI00107F5AA0|nr:hypothetical protein [Halosimplex halophilum]
MHTRTAATRDSSRVDSAGIRTMHDIFSDWERRAILYHLQSVGGRSSVEALAAHLVGWWRGREEPAEVDGELVDRVRRRLGCAHLSKLDDFGVLAYDPRSGTVRLSEEMKLSVSEPWTDRSGCESAGRVLGDLADDAAPGAEAGTGAETEVDGPSGCDADVTTGGGRLS